jgi:hypothetical protein
MKSEEKINGLERLMKLFVREGMRARREMNEKINMLIDSQIRTDELLVKFDERCKRYDVLFAKYDERFAKHDERFAKNDKRIKELGERTDKTLEILMGLLKERQNGRSDNPSQI